MLLRSMREREKKRQDNQRIIQIDGGSFTPLIFTINRGSGREKQIFIKALSVLSRISTIQGVSEKADRFLYKEKSLKFISLLMMYVICFSCKKCAKSQLSLRIWISVKELSCCSNPAKSNAEEAIEDLILYKFLSAFLRHPVTLYVNVNFLNSTYNVEK